MFCGEKEMLACQRCQVLFGQFSFFFLTEKNFSDGEKIYTIASHRPFTKGKRATPLKIPYIDPTH